MQILDLSVCNGRQTVSDVSCIVKVVFSQITQTTLCDDKPETAIKAFQFLNNLIIKLGLVISENKLYETQKCIPCLGINVNIDTGIISIPD